MEGDIEVVLWCLYPCIADYGSYQRLFDGREDMTEGVDAIVEGGGILDGLESRSESFHLADIMEVPSPTSISNPSLMSCINSYP